MSAVVVDQKNPWPGLSSFDEQQRDFFCGREVEVSELLRLVKRETLTVLFGQSGLGKTSLLQAGLFPQLRNEEFLPIYIRLKYVKRDANDPSPVQQLKLDLAAALQAAKIEVAPPGEETLWEYFHREDLDFWNPRNRLITPVLVFDQFEEIFTLGRASDIPAAWITELLDELHSLVQHTVPASVRARLEADPGIASRYDFEKENVKIIFSFREDFLPEFEGLRAQFPAMAQNRFRLQRLKGNQALEVITKPAGDLIEKPVALAIINFVSHNKQQQQGSQLSEAELANREVEPALLSVVCRELNNRRLNRNQARISADDLTSSEKILREFYEHALVDLDLRVRVFLEDKLLTVAGFRTRVPRADATDESHNPGVSETTIQTLIDRRLLRQEESGGVVWIELIHDLLTGVILASRTERQHREKAEAERREMEARQQAEAELVRQAAEAKTRRYRALARRIGWAGIVAVSGLLILGSAIYLHIERASKKNIEQERDHNKELAKNNASLAKSNGDLAKSNGALAEFNRTLAESNRIEANKNLMSYYAQLGRQAFSDREYDQAALCFGEIYRNDSTNNAVNQFQLWQALFMGERDIDSVVLDDLPARTASADFSTDGKLAVAGADGVIKVWRLDEASSAGKLMGVLDGPFDARTKIRFVPGGSLLISTGSNNSVFAWDVTNATYRSLNNSGVAEKDEAGALSIESGTSNAILKRIGAAEPIIALQSSPEAGVWLSASLHHVVVWNAADATNKNMAQFDSDPGNAFRSAQFDQSGKFIITAEADETNRAVTSKIWDARNGQNLDTVDGLVFAAANSAGTRILTVRTNEEANGCNRGKVWRVSQMRLPQILSDKNGDIVSASFMADSDRVATVSGGGGLRHWEAQSGMPVEAPLANMGGEAAQATVNAAASQVLTIGAGGEARFWSSTNQPVLRDQSVVATCGAISPDGRHAAVGAEDGRWFKWNSATGALVKTSAATNGAAIKSIQFHPVFDLLLTGNGNNAILWRGRDGKKLCEYGSGACAVAVFDPAGMNVVVGLNDGGVAIYDFLGVFIKKWDAHQGKVSELKFNSDGKLLASRGGDGKVKIWDFPSGRLHSTLADQEHGAQAVAVAFSPDSELLATGCADQKARVWKIKTGDLLETFRGYRGPVETVQFSPDGRRLLTASRSDGTAKLWNIFNADQNPENMKQCLQRIDRDIAWHFDPAHQIVPGSMRSASLAYALDGSTNACAGTNVEDLRAAGLMAESAREDLLDNKVIEALESLRQAEKQGADWVSVKQLLAEAELMTNGLRQTLPLPRGRIRDLKFSPAANQLLIGSFGAPTVLMDVGTTKISALTNGLSNRVGGPERSDWTVAFSADGKLAAAAGGKDGRDGVVDVWDTANFTNVVNLALDSLPSKIEFSKNGILVVVTQDGQARLWDSASGATNSIPPDTNNNAAPVFAFSPDGTLLALGYDSGLVQLANLAKLFHHQSGAVEALNEFTNKIAWLDFNPGSSRLVAAATGATNLGIWNLTPKREFQPVPGATGIERVIFNPDGGELISVSTNGQSIEVWDADTLKPVRSQNLGLGPVNDMAFDESGQRVVVATKNGKVAIWDARTGALAGMLQGQEHPFVRAAISRDKKTIATGTGTSVRLWNADEVTDTPLKQTRINVGGVIVARAFQPKAGQFILAVTNNAGLGIIRANATNAGSEKPLALESGPTGGTAISTFISPDGNWLLAGTGGNTVGIWETQNGRLVKSLTNETAVTAMTINASATLAATADAGGVSIWSFADGRRIGRLANSPNTLITRLVFDPSDERVLAISRNHAARLWDWKNSDVKICFSGDFDNAWFSGDGRRMITSQAGTAPSRTPRPTLSPNDTAKIWDVETGKLLGNLGDEEEEIVSVEFTKGGRFILTAGAKGAKLWDAATAKELYRFDLHGAPVMCCTWLDGQRLLSLSSNGEVWTHGVIAKGE